MGADMQVGARGDVGWRGELCALYSESKVRDGRDGDLFGSRSIGASWRDGGWKQISRGSEVEMRGRGNRGRLIYIHGKLLKLCGRGTRSVGFSGQWTLYFTAFGRDATVAARSCCDLWTRAPQHVGMAVSANQPPILRLVLGATGRRLSRGRGTCISTPNEWEDMYRPRVLLRRSSRPPEVAGVRRSGQAFRRTR